MLVKKKKMGLQEKKNEDSYDKTMHGSKSLKWFELCSSTSEPLWLLWSLSLSKAKGNLAIPMGKPGF